MPSPTFFRLADEKRRRVFDAAVEEFAAHRFSEASINRVIKAAGIPRGSFYQYFVNKEDLYTYVLEEIGKEKIDILSLQQMQSMGELDFYQLILSSLPGIFRWTEQNPVYSRIAMLMMEDGGEFIQRIFRNMDSSQSYARTLLEREQQAGRLRDGVDVEMAIKLLLSSAALMLRYYFEAGDMAEAEQRLRALYDIICFGILRKEAL